MCKKKRLTKPFFSFIFRGIISHLCIEKNKRRKNLASFQQDKAKELNKKIG